MSKMKFAMAMLAMGGGVGAAVQAQATTVRLDIPADQPLTQITLVGSTPQFDYGANSPKSSVFSTDAFFHGGTPNSALGIETTNPGWPAPGETYSNSIDTTEFKGIPSGPTYIHLTFTSDSTTYTGVAYIDARAELETISYAAVPEPEAWALLIAGAALTGGALRTARRRQAAIA
jgi:hypothetical protein